MNAPDPNKKYTLKLIDDETGKEIINEKFPEMLLTYEMTNDLVPVYGRSMFSVKNHVSRGFSLSIKAYAPNENFQKELVEAEYGK